MTAVIDTEVTTALALIEPEVEPAEEVLAEIVDAEIVDEDITDEDITASVDTTVLDLPRAQRLDKKIRAAGEKIASGYDSLMNLMEQAADGSIHVALGYGTLVDYFNNAVDFKPTDADERKLMVEALSSKGFSQRLTAKVLGASQSTVRDDLAAAKASGSYSPPAKKTGVDNKEYVNQEAAEKPAQGDADESPKPQQAKALTAALGLITKAAERLEASFTDTDNFDADVNPELIADAFKEIRAAQARINKVGKTLSALNK